MVAEQIGQREFAFESTLQPVVHPAQVQRGTAQIEEAGVAVYVVEPEDGAPLLGDECLEGAAQ